MSRYYNRRDRDQALQVKEPAPDGPVKVAGKNPRTYKLRVWWTETRHYEGVGTFKNKTERDNARALIERSIERDRRRAKPKYLVRWEDTKYVDTLSRVDCEKAVATPVEFIEEN